MSGTSILVVANDVPRATREFYRRWGRTAGERVFFCDGTDDEVEINQALDMAADIGGVVRLSEGTFNTAAEIDFPADNITLEGSNGATMINCTAVVDAVITSVGRTRTVIQNLRMSGDNDGILISGTSFAKVRGNYLTGQLGATTGVKALNADTCSVTGNVIDAYGTGVSGDASTTGGVISNNDLTTCTTKISLAGSGTAVRNNAGAADTGAGMFIPLLIQGTLVVANDVIPPGVAIPAVSTLTKATARLGTAPVGASLIVEVLADGVTITTLTVPDGSLTVTNDPLSVPLQAGSIITVDVMQVGSTTPGADLAIDLECH